MRNLEELCISVSRAVHNPEILKHVPLRKNDPVTSMDSIFRVFFPELKIDYELEPKIPGAVRIHWTDGPSYVFMAAISYLFEDNKTAWNKEYGYIEKLLFNRTYSKEARREVLEATLKEFGSSLRAADFYGDYAGRYWYSSPENNTENTWYLIVQDRLDRASF